MSAMRVGVGVPMVVPMVVGMVVFMVVFMGMLVPMPVFAAAAGIAMGGIVCMIVRVRVLAAAASAMPMLMGVMLMGVIFMRMLFMRMAVRVVVSAATAASLFGLGGFELGLALRIEGGHERAGLRASLLDQAGKGRVIAHPQAALHDLDALVMLPQLMRQAQQGIGIAACFEYGFGGRHDLDQAAIFQLQRIAAAQGNRQIRARDF